MAGVFGQGLYSISGSVAGLSLQPFSAHHAMALIECNSPYLCGGTVTQWDTTAALVICQSKRSEGLTGIARLSVSAWQKIRWRYFWIAHNHDDVSASLQDHIASSARYPNIWMDKERGQGKATGAPWPFYLVSVIAQEMPAIPYAQLWDMPLCELACHKAVIDERTGGAEIAEKQLGDLRRFKEAENG